LSNISPKTHNALALSLSNKKSSKTRRNKTKIVKIVTNSERRQMEAKKREPSEKRVASEEKTNKEKNRVKSNQYNIYPNQLKSIEQI
jgi:K+/H+ antiporter YhaU regulatory subunit KhtT